MTALMIAVGAIADETFTREADAFLKQRSAGWQTRQLLAIRDAVSGNGDALAAIRRGRNGAAILPDGVLARYVTPELRLYYPAEPSQEKRPLLLYFHGGGWTIGSINSCSRFCGELVRRGNMLVLALDYRLAPEHPYPAALEDCVAAVEYAAERVGSWGGAKELISLGGDSSGGNLAIATTMRIQQEKQIGIRSLILFYPVTRAWEDQSESWRNFGSGFGLDAELMQEFNEVYRNGEEARNPEISPACASGEVLAGFPPTLLVAADRDILRDQGREFAEMLKNAGVPVQYHLLGGSVHLFITVPGQERAFQTALTLAATSLRQLAASGTE